MSGLYVCNMYVCMYVCMHLFKAGLSVSCNWTSLCFVRLLKGKGLCPMCRCRTCLFGSDACLEAVYSSMASGRSPGIDVRRHIH